MEKIYIKGILGFVKEENKVFNGRESGLKTWLTLKDAIINETDFDKIKAVFSDAGAKFTPAWIKDFKGYVNVSTKYDIPTQLPTGENGALLDLIADGKAVIGAKCVLCLALKPEANAIYPYAIKVSEMGENRRATFDDFPEEVPANIDTVPFD